MTLYNKSASIGIGLKTAYTLNFCQVDKPNVPLLKLKKTENGEWIIARLIETEDSKVAITIILPLMTVEKTYQINLVEKDEWILIPFLFNCHAL